MIKIKSGKFESGLASTLAPPRPIKTWQAEEVTAQQSFTLPLKGASRCRGAAARAIALLGNCRLPGLAGTLAPPRPIEISQAEQVTARQSLALPQRVNEIQAGFVKIPGGFRLNGELISMR